MMKMSRAKRSEKRVGKLESDLGILAKIPAGRMVENPKLCPKINACYKIKMILDKDMCDFQYSDSIKAVCKICKERKEDK